MTDFIKKTTTLASEAKIVFFKSQYTISLENKIILFYKNIKKVNINFWVRRKSAENLNVEQLLISFLLTLKNDTKVFLKNKKNIGQITFFFSVICRNSFDFLLVLYTNLKQWTLILFKDLFIYYSDLYNIFFSAPIAAGYNRIKLYNSEEHPFHLVTNSPWPILTAFSVLNFCTSLISFFSYSNHGYTCTIFTLIVLLLVFFGWFSDIDLEANTRGYHTKAVQRGLTLSIILFILSEIMFFFSFFWAFFHSSLAPSIFIGGVWPPKDIQPLHTGYIPLLNTIILLFSGVTITTTHKLLVTYGTVNSEFYLKVRNTKTPNILFRRVELRISELEANRFIFTEAVLFLWYTLALAILFTYFQKYEYATATFSINDSIYGSVFFLITGFHGFHVIIGTLMILVQYFKFKKRKVQTAQHIGFESASWYWHFVDIVWLFLIMFLYLWSSQS